MKRWVAGLTLMVGLVALLTAQLADLFDRVLRSAWDFSIRKRATWQTARSR